jgi:wyosine [tRNA(Phe)-imidazoG37] synthetase (radical SAM superfamily)
MSIHQPSSVFTRHSRDWQSNQYVYPVISRRSRGLSIGINLNPDKACNFDCVYCSVDRSQPVGPARPDPVPDRGVSLPLLRSELEHMLDLAIAGELFRMPPLDQAPPDLARLNDIAFSGDGEPTACRQFEPACRLVTDVLAARHLRDVRIVLITNATLLHRPIVQQALRLLDRHNGQIWAKLDAGTEAFYRQVDRTIIPFQQVLDNILLTGRQRPIVIQSMFMEIHGLPPIAEEIDAYLNRLRDLRDGGCRISLVQVYTVARHPAEAYVTPLCEDELDRIGERVRRLELPVETFHAAG